MTYTIEHEIKVFDDENGGFVSVGPDRDGLGLVELRQNDDGKEVVRISMTLEHAQAFGKALTEYLGMVKA